MGKSKARTKPQAIAPPEPPPPPEPKECAYCEWFNYIDSRHGRCMLRPPFEAVHPKDRCSFFERKSPPALA